MPPDTTERAIIIFVKYPTPGAVKTRLVAGVGPLTSSQLYKACAEHTVRVACRCSSKPEQFTGFNKVVQQALDFQRCCTGVKRRRFGWLMRLRREGTQSSKCWICRCGFGWIL